MSPATSPVEHLTSLSEVNIAMQRFTFGLLHDLLGDRWRSQEQIVYYHTDDQNSHFEHYMRIRNREPATVEFPLAVVIRSPDIQLTMGHNDAHRHEVHWERIIQGKPAELEYQIVLYENRHLHLENFVDKFVLRLYSTGDRLRFSFRSKVLGSGEDGSLLRNEITVNFPDPPSYSLVPGFSEIKQGSGNIYSLSLTAKVYTMLGERTQPDNLVTSIEQRFHNWGPEDELDPEAGLLVPPLRQVQAALWGPVVRGGAPPSPGEALLTEDSFLAAPAAFTVTPAMVSGEEGVFGFVRSSRELPVLSFSVPGNEPFYLGELSFRPGDGKTVVGCYSSGDGSPLAHYPPAVAFRIAGVLLRLSEAELLGGGRFAWELPFPPAHGLDEDGNPRLVTGDAILVEVLGDPVTLLRKVLWRGIVEPSPRGDDTLFIDGALPNGAVSPLSDPPALSGEDPGSPGMGRIGSLAPFADRDGEHPANRIVAPEENGGGIFRFGALLFRARRWIPLDLGDGGGFSPHGEFFLRVEEAGNPLRSTDPGASPLGAHLLSVGDTHYRFSSPTHGEEIVLPGSDLPSFHRWVGKTPFPRPPLSSVEFS